MCLYKEWWIFKFSLTMQNENAEYESPNLYIEKCGIYIITIHAMDIEGNDDLMANIYGKSL